MSKYSPEHCSQTPSVYVLALHSYKITLQMIGPCILIIRFFGRWREDSVEIHPKHLHSNWL